MRIRICRYVLITFCLPTLCFGQWADDVLPLNKAGEFTIRSRAPEDLQNLPGPSPTAPPTVSIPHPNATEVQFTLDEAIRVALENSEVIRVLTGNTAVASGQTIYAPAIAHTAIDSELGAFDPVLSANNTYSRSGRNEPFPPTPAIPAMPPDPAIPAMPGGFNRITSNANGFDIGVSQRNLTGGIGSVSFIDNWLRSGPRGVLNSSNRPAIDVSYTQPFLRGGGVCANRVPIILARIQTEQSYFRFKGSYQNLVRSVIGGYWNLVFARTDLWAREQQVALAKFLYEQAEAEKRFGLADSGQVAQRRVALSNFRVSLIAARATLLDAEAALQNVLGLPPNDGVRLIPVTPPTRDEIEFNWEELVNTATVYRPDLIELKLVLDADNQQIIRAQNGSLPTLNGVASYQWNGVHGQLLDGRRLNSGLRGGSYTLGVNFEVPIGLRSSRANLRTQELILARDRANLRQGQHAATHEIAQSLRSLASTYQQYEAYILVREAALENLKQLAGRRRSGLADFQVVLQGIADWGNAVSSEARSLTQYNSQLAQLEQQTGTILETHGIRFYEERYASLGPLAAHGACLDYPQSLRPRENSERYEFGEDPAEEFFDLEEAPQTSKQRDPIDDDAWRPEEPNLDDNDPGFEIDKSPYETNPGFDTPVGVSPTPPVPLNPKWKSVYDR